MVTEVVLSEFKIEAPHQSLRYFENLSVGSFMRYIHMQFDKLSSFQRGGPQSFGNYHRHAKKKYQLGSNFSL